MDKKEMAVAQAEEKTPVEEREFTEEQNKAQHRMFENDFHQWTDCGGWIPDR